MSFEVEASIELSKSLWREGKFADATRVLLPVVSEARHARSIAGLHLMLSILQRHAGSPFSAKRTLAAAERWVRECRDDVLSGKLANAYGLACQQIREYDSAFDHLRRAVSFHERGGARLYAAESRGNIGALLIAMDAPAEALPHLDRAIRECVPAAAAQFLESKARALLALRRYDEARSAAHESISLLRRETNARALLDVTLRTLGLIDYEEAAGDLRHACAEIEELDSFRRGA